MRATRFPARADGPADRITGFLAHLRMNGLVVGPREGADALAALSQVEAADPVQSRLALKVLLVPDREVWRKFDELFDAYWFNTGRQKVTSNAHVRTQYLNAPLFQQQNEDGDSGDAGTDRQADRPDTGDGEAEGTDGQLIATRTVNLYKRDLRELMDEQSIAEAGKAAEKLARALRDRRSRRRRMAWHGRRIDIRKTIRASLSHGGDPLDLHRSKRPDRPMQITALLDVSGSMTVYSRVFLSFLKGLISADTRADAYLFHTRLMRVTPVLKDHDTLRAAGRLSLMAEGFGGGTDISGSLQRFMDGHGSRALNRRTVVVILSDGYCTSPPAQLGEVLARIGKRAGRIVWLNPLKGWRDYAPVAVGMAAALPHLDAHLPANTIEALGALEQEFARL